MSIPSATKSVRLSDVSHGFSEEATLFERLTFDAVPGEILGLCGPSGSGKSTLLSIIAGWTSPTLGTVERVGIRKTNWVFQNPFGVPNRTALDQVVLPLLAKGLRRGEAEFHATTVMETFNLRAVMNRPFSALSGGEAQRLMLARAVCVEPDLLLVDEPTAQLDTRTAETVNEALSKIALRDTIIIVATHDQRTRESCARIIDLADFVQLG